ncbi:MAG: hypothetical protein C4297_03240 [Gemmataceae bacterium]
MPVAMVLEKEYIRLHNLSQVIPGWLRVLGVLALVALGVWALVAVLTYLIRGEKRLFYGLTGKFADVAGIQPWKPRSFWLWLFLTAIGFAGAALAYALARFLDRVDAWHRTLWPLFAFGSVGAILAVSWEFVIELASLSWRRIWALARFSILEAIRRKALWSFVVLLVVFLFASWFIPLYRRPEDQWRTYVDLTFFVTTALLLITASVLASFSLPSDIRNQSIHTVVSKPVRRLEIILGRILGLTVLLTAVLLVTAHLSLLYVFRTLNNPEARELTMRARSALYGALHFEETDSQGNWVPSDRGINVGREWEYRQHIRGGSSMQAVWEFRDLPARLAEYREIPVEFSFDIFRTSKGGLDDYREGVNIQVSFVNTRKWDYSRLPEYLAYVDEKTQLRPDPDKLARDFGFYQLPTPIKIMDYRSYTVTFPGALLEDLADGALQVRVQCLSHNQYLGMAAPDLYVIASEGNFYVNFLKGVVGIWYILVLVVTLGIVFSTYLSALTGLSLTWLLTLCGLPRMRDVIWELSTPGNIGGGPLEAAIRLAQRQNLITPLEQTTTVRILLTGDEGIRYFFRGLLNVLPDLGQYDRTMFIAEGFNIPVGDLLASFICLLGYLLPFLVIGYFLLTAREIAQ